MPPARHGYDSYRGFGCSNDIVFCLTLVKAQGLAEIHQELRTNDHFLVFPSENFPWWGHPAPRTPFSTAKRTLAMPHEENIAIGMIGMKRARSVATKAAWCALVGELEEEERARSRARERREWWIRALRKRAPVLSGGTGMRRGGRFFGRRSNYGQDFDPPMSPAEFYLHFRFAATEIPRLVLALHMPARIRSSGGCVMDGEEALLLYLRVRPFLSRRLAIDLNSEH